MTDDPPFSTCLGAIHKGYPIFGPFFDLPTYLYPISSHCNVSFSIVISDFWKPTHLPKNRTSFVDATFEEELEKFPTPWNDFFEII